MTIRVGIVGISGFGGGEALRLVAAHPEFELVHSPRASPLRGRPWAIASPVCPKT